MAPAATTAPSSTMKTNWRPVAMMRPSRRLMPTARVITPKRADMNPRVIAPKPSAPFMAAESPSTGGGRYSEPCLIISRSDSKRRLSPLVPCTNRPSQTTGAPSLNSSPGSPRCTTETVLPPSVTLKATPPSCGTTLPATTAPAMRRRPVSSGDFSWACTASDTVRK